jgi:cytochrome c553
MAIPRSLVLLAIAAACREQGAVTGTGPQAAQVPSAARTAVDAELATADLAVARAGCVRCHHDEGDRRAVVRGPRLDDAVRWRAADGGAAFLRAHHGGPDADALAAWIADLGRDLAPAVAGMPAPGAFARGERLQRELACGACHAPAQFAELPARVDHARLAAFLADPTVRVPGIVHVPLARGEAGDVAAWLLRAQRIDTTAQPGFAWTAWRLPINDAGMPELAGVDVAATGTAAAIDTGPGPRAHDYALRFDAELDVPAGGEWTFVTASDDSSWLWIDDERVVENEGIAPLHRGTGKCTLTAGPHALTVLFTQAAGGASLEVRWRGPGVDDEPLPASRAMGRRTLLAPPAPPSAPAAELVAVGRAAARARRCDACHDFADARFEALPAPPSARAFGELREGPCPLAPAGEALASASRAAAAAPASPARDLFAAMQRDGCSSCHVRDGRGGMPPAVMSQLAVVEDIGDEGRLPPDLTNVGRRLRAAWIERVLAEGHSVRPYLRVRMPKVTPAKAHEYASLFAQVDGVDERPEPAYSIEAVQRGRRLAGAGARNCITCHRFQDHPALGPQGMDLAIQNERLQPGWFRDWLLHPATLRPGTRMPASWWRDDDEARADTDAIRTWLSLGAQAPAPPGLKEAPGSWDLVASDGPRLHGCFLAGVSARCLAVATPERVHFAFDLATPRLVWLWRGEFLDTSGTWKGRAGRLLRPLGVDWRVLDDAAIGGGAPRRLRGWRVAADGYPVLRVAVGDAEYEDEARARLTETGGEVVRRLTALRGELDVVFPPPAEDLQVLANDQPAALYHLAPGAPLEVVYRW